MYNFILNGWYSSPSEPLNIYNKLKYSADQIKRPIISQVVFHWMTAAEQQQQIYFTTHEHNKPDLFFNLTLLPSEFFLILRLSNRVTGQLLSSSR